MITINQLDEKSKNRGSEKSFGWVMVAFFTLVNIYFWFKFGNIPTPLLILLSCLLTFTVFYAKIFYWPNIAWYWLGIILHHIVSPVMLGFIFLGVFLPTRIILGLFGKKLMKLKKQHTDTYWIKREKQPHSFDNQF